VTLLLGSAGALGRCIFFIPGLCLPESEPIRVGCLAPMTGPSFGAERSASIAALILRSEAINRPGGVKGRKIEIGTRDTQGVRPRR